MEALYPEIQPYRSGFLQVSDEHSIYWEESGNPEGMPILFLHGGPGSGTEPKHRRFFNPQKYRMILTDQRGSGKSTPHACLNHNTTWDLVADLEKLRNLLKIEKWILFGGSWGSTLALAYAETHSSIISGMILRGIFLGRKKELRWFYQFGAHHLFPDAWEEFIRPIPKEEHGDLITAYYKRLTSCDSAVRAEAAKAWSTWEGATLKLNRDSELMQQFTQDHFADAHARIECHYFIHHCFFETDNWLIENINKIRHIPAVIIHGRYDVICPVENAWELHRAWPEARLEIVPAAGHSASEPGITDALVRATNAF